MRLPCRYTKLRITFTGTKVDSTTVTQSFVIDDNPTTLQTFYFSDDFTNLISAHWDHAPYKAYTFDNINVTNLSAVPEPLTILGTGTAVAFGGAFKRKLAKKK